MKEISEKYIFYPSKYLIFLICLYHHGGKDKSEILDILKDRKYIFQKFLSKAKINSKFTPRLSFYLDDTFDEAEKIENLLLNKNVLRDIK